MKGAAKPADKGVVMALLLSCVAGDLILSVLAVILSGWRRATPIVYGGTLVISRS